MTGTHFCDTCWDVFQQCKSSLDDLFHHSATFSKILNFTRDLFKIFSLVLNSVPDGKAMGERFKKLDGSIADIKRSFSIIRIPEIARVIVKACRKTYSYSFKVYQQWKNGESIDRHDVLKIIAYSSKMISKTVSLFNRSVMTPFFLIEKHFSLKDDLKKINDCWCVVSLIGKRFKIYYASCKLIESDDLLIDAIELIISVSSVTLRIVKLFGYKAHPGISLSLSIIEDLISIFLIVRELSTYENSD